MDGENVGPNLMKLFDPSKTSNHNHAYWDSVLDFLDTIWNSVRQVTVFQNYLRYLLTRLMKCRCDDKRVVTRIVKLHWHVTVLAAEVQNSEFGREIWNFILESIEKNGHVFDAQRLYICVENADVDLMKVLIMYGMSGPFHEISYYDFKKAEKYLVKFWTASQTHEFGSFGDLNIRARVLVKQLLSHLRFKGGVWTSGRKTRGCVRIIVINWILRAIILSWERHPSLDDHIRCVRLYFRSIPQPFISKNELQWFLRHLFCFSRCTEGVKRITDLYETLFDLECSFPYRPRTLKHLCRCSVRNSLSGHSKTLPETVHTLDIPITLKHYLLGDLENDP